MQAPKKKDRLNRYTNNLASKIKEMLNLTAWLIWQCKVLQVKETEAPYILRSLTVHTGIRILSLIYLKSKGTNNNTRTNLVRVMSILIGPREKSKICKEKFRVRQTKPNEISGR